MIYHIEIPKTLETIQVEISFHLNVILIGAMKLFQSVQKCFLMLGIYSPQHHRNAALKNVPIFYILSQGSITTACYLLFKADSVRDYGDSFYATVTQLLTIIYFFNLISKMASIYQLIDDLKRFVGKSSKMPFFSFLHKQFCLNNKLIYLWYFR